MTETTSLSRIDEASLDALFRHARTAKTFTAEPVPEADLRAIYDLVKMGPTSMNLQSLRIVFVQSPDQKARLSEHISEANRPKAASAPVNAILAADIDFHETLHITTPHFPNAKESFAEATRREVMARGQAWLAAGYFIMAVRALGYAAGPMGGFKAASLDADFFADSAWRSICVVNIGKPGPDAWHERAPRLDFDYAVRVV